MGDTDLSKVGVRSSSNVCPVRSHVRRSSDDEAGAMMSCIRSIWDVVQQLCPELRATSYELKVEF